MTNPLVGSKLLRIDEVSAAVTYLGYGRPGSASGDPVWRIIRLTKTGSETVIEYVDGNTEFISIWSNRAALSYS